MKQYYLLKVTSFSTTYYVKLQPKDMHYRLTSILRGDIGVQVLITRKTCNKEEYSRIFKDYSPYSKMVELCNK